MIYIYLNNDLQVKASGISTRNQHQVLFISTRNQQLDFCHKELCPKSFVNPRHISEVINQTIFFAKTISVGKSYSPLSIFWNKDTNHVYMV